MASTAIGTDRTGRDRPCCSMLQLCAMEQQALPPGLSSKLSVMAQGGSHPPSWYRGMHAMGEGDRGLRCDRSCCMLYCSELLWHGLG